MYALATRLLALSALILGVVGAPVAQGEEEYPKPPKAIITGFSYSGTGCPSNSVAGMYEPDFTSLTLGFDAYVASAGPLTPIGESRKNCQLIIGFEYTPGWKYAILTTEYRGYLLLDEGVSALQRSDYWFDGDTDKTFFYSTWDGPYEEDYNFSDDVEKEIATWSPCDSSANNLYINTQIRVNNMKNRDGSGLITTDTITQRVTHVYGVVWERC